MFIELLIIFGIRKLAFAQTDSLLNMLGLNTGRAGTVNRIPIDDITSQSLRLVNYLKNVQKNPDNNLLQKLKDPFPKVTFIDGLPAVPGLMGSLPGAGGCLPKQTPLVNQNSPSFFQNFLRFIPGAQDYLTSLIKTPNVDFKSLSGKYQWVVSTKGVHKRFCPTTEFKNVVEKGNTSSINIVDSFHEDNFRGPARVGFGYGIIHNQKVFIYFQEDPCPYQIVMLGPKNTDTAQYEYIVLSNWAKYPLIAMARDYNYFNENYRKEFVEHFRNEGYISEISGVVGDTVNFIDWSQCKPLTPVGFLSNVLHQFLFG